MVIYIKLIIKLKYVWSQNFYTIITLSLHKKNKLSNDWVINRLRNKFQADELGHQAKIDKADLGYVGFIMD